jgi:hypothetical protein
MSCHVVTTHLTHSSEVSFIHGFSPDKLILNTQHQPYVFITNGCGDDRRLSCEAFVSKPSTLAQTFGPHQQIQLVDHISRCLDLPSFRVRVQITNFRYVRNHCFTHREASKCYCSIQAGKITITSSTSYYFYNQVGTTLPTSDM